MGCCFIVYIIASYRLDQQSLELTFRICSPRCIPKDDVKEARVWKTLEPTKGIRFDYNNI